MKISKIVFATDFSTQAREAAVHAVHLARRQGAEVVFAHGHPLSASQPNHAEEVLGTEAFRKELAQAVDRVHAQLTKEREELAGDGTNTSQVLVDEPIDEGMAQAIRELGGELLVVGSQGKTGWSRAFLGSVAEKLVMSQEIPVLVARGPAPPAGYRRILVPVDHTAASRRQVEAAVGLAAENAEIVLLHCWALPYVAYGVFAEQGALMADLAEETRRKAGRENELLMGDFVGQNVQLHSAILESRPAAGIRTYLEEKAPFDLVVVGSHRTGRALRFLIGSTAASTVRHASCSVLVLRPPA